MMMPARNQPWYMRFFRRQFPPREPKPAPSLSDQAREQAETRHWRAIRDRYDASFRRYRKGLDEIKQRTGRQRQ